MSVRQTVSRLLPDLGSSATLGILDQYKNYASLGLTGTEPTLNHAAHEFQPDNLGLPVRHELSGTVGRIIARHRAAMKITQEQLSLALDVDLITISRFERGVSLPSLITIQQLCKIFGVSLSEFFSESGEPDAGAVSGESAALLALFDTLQKDERSFVITTLKQFCRLSAKRRRQ